jgi:AcrR family transcriptional regulator
VKRQVAKNWQDPPPFKANRLENRPTGRYFVKMRTLENNETATRILNSVKQLILEGGLPAVTLSAVCRQAAISKGGLVHHYPSKESLVRAFIQRASDEYLASIRIALKNCPNGIGSRARAFVDLILGNEDMYSEEANRDCTSVMMALIQGGYSEITRRMYSELVQELRHDGLPLDVAETVMAAVDGVWLQSMIESGDVVSSRAARIRMRLLKLIEQEQANELSAANVNQKQKSNP